MFKRPILIFVLLFVLTAAIFIFCPIYIFDGVTVYELDGHLREFPSKLRLGYFFGLGYTEDQVAHVRDFYLIKTGWANLVLLVFGIPALIAYRVHLAKQKDAVQQK